MLNNFDAYQRAKEFYRACQRVRLSRALAEQLHRASASIALNLAEGAGRATEPEKRRHYTIAFGSLQECRAILDIEGKGDEELVRLANRLAAMLYRLSRGSARPVTPPQTDTTTDTTTVSTTDTTTDTTTTRDPSL